MVKDDIIFESEITLNQIYRTFGFREESGTVEHHRKQGQHDTWGRGHVSGHHIEAQMCGCHVLEQYVIGSDWYWAKLTGK